MAYSNIAESLLEMHYFRVLVRRYQQQLGRKIHVFKPATTAEHWYGFDQAYFTADIPRPDVIQDLRDFIHNNASRSQIASPTSEKGRSKGATA